MSYICALAPLILKRPVASVSGEGEEVDVQEITHSHVVNCVNIVIYHTLNSSIKHTWPHISNDKV